MASPRETPPKKRCPASMISFGWNRLSSRGGCCCGGPAGTVPVGGSAGAVCATHGATPNPAKSEPKSRATTASRWREFMACPLNPLLTRFRLTLGETYPNHSTIRHNYDRSTAETEALRHSFCGFGRCSAGAYGRSAGGDRRHHRTAGGGLAYRLGD